MSGVMSGVMSGTRSAGGRAGPATAASALVRLADRLSNAAPEPSAAFRADLRRRLMAVARQQAGPAS